MARIDWLIAGKSFGNCNCDYGCPCQFESLPNPGGCSGVEVFEIEKGHFGGLKLDGLRAAMIYSWPGPIFEGNGQMQVIIDARKATASIPGVLETEGRPITSPATGQDHRVRIDMPGGIEFDIAEIGSGSATTKGAIAFTLKESYGQFNRLRHHGGGVIR